LTKALLKAALFLYNYSVMHLKKLEIYGFKSFGSKSTLDFEPNQKEAEITAIVGPNGSGKSNVADAIRWVLGEQSNNILRSKKSEDVIFCGSELKSRSSYAEVTITLTQEKEIVVEINNKKHSFSEISLSRRLYRSGESDYYINQKKARLLDIQEMLAYLGFGQTTYTIIGQGMVDRLLFFNATERKVLFDEAAGVKQYKIKRDQSLKRLTKTDENLIRLNDILMELEPRVIYLGRLVKKAEGRKEIDVELEKLQTSFYNSTFWEFEKKINFYKSENSKYETELELISSKINLAQRSLSKQAEKKTIAEKEESANQRLSHLFKLRDQLIRDIAYLEGQISNQEQNEKIEEDQKDLLTKEKPQLIDKISHLEVLIKSNSTEVGVVRKKIESLEINLEKLQQEEELLELKKDEVSNNDSSDSLATIEGRIIGLERNKMELRDKAFLLERGKDLFAKQADESRGLKAQLQLLDKQAFDLSKELKELVIKKQKEKIKIEDKEKLIKNIVQEINKKEKEVLQVNDQIGQEKITEIEATLTKLQEQKEIFSNTLIGSNKTNIKKSFDMFSQLFSTSVKRILDFTKSLDPINRKKIEGVLQSLRLKLENEKENLTDLVLTFNKLGSELEINENKTKEIESKIRSLNQGLAQLSRQTDQAKIKENMEKVESDLELVEDQIRLLKEEKEPFLETELEKQKTYLTKKNNILNSIRDLNKSIYQENLLLTKTTNILENQQNEKVNSEKRLQELSKKIDSFTNHKEPNQDEYRLQKHRFEMGGLEQKIKRLKDELEYIVAEKKELEEKERTKEQEVRSYEKQVFEINQKLNEIIMNLSHFQTKKEGIIEEAKGLSLGNGQISEAKELSQEEKDILKAKIENLKRKKETIGGVDPETILEYEELDKRASEMRQQVDDLTSAKTDLVKIISELDQKIKNQFTETFSEIAKQFNYYFNILFTGGRAKLELGEDEEKNLGVEISASPPGKKNQSLNVLSGGERTLTSLALLFAILSVNPSPFCVLDEVDAALDESNTIRFLDILRKLKEKTQFVIITHNRETMSVANLLYGVTMSENHISKLISVKLSDANKIVED